MAAFQAQDFPTQSQTLTAEGACIVSEINVTVGTVCAANDVLLSTELMKMQHHVRAPFSCRIAQLHVEAGQVLENGAPMITVTRHADNENISPDAGGGVSQRPDLAELLAREASLIDENRPEAVERRRASGQRTARENVADLLDDQPNEYGALALAAQRSRFNDETLRQKSPGDGIITATGTVNVDQFGADAARCAVMAVDYTVMAGTQGFFHHKKMDRLLEIAIDRKLPVIMFAEGGGGRPNDVDTHELVVAQLYVPSFARFAKLAGVAPRATIVSGHCFAGNAAFPGMSDVIIATRKSHIGMGGPAMVEGGGLGQFAPEEIGPSHIQSPNGVIDILVENEAEAVEAAKKWLGYFQGPLSDYDAPKQDALRDVVPEDRRTAYRIRDAIDLLFDKDSVLELRSEFGRGMVTVLARIEGKPFGVIANNPMHLGGAIDADAADKAARFMQLCDTFGLPIISLCDTPGFMVGPEIEAQAQVRHVSRMFLIGAHLTVPLFTVLLRKGYGLGAMAMSGGGMDRSVLTVSWPSGEIGAMGLEGAVRLGSRKTLANISDPAEREAEYERQVAELYERGKAVNAASLLELDAVIDPAQTRDWILRGLSASGPVQRSSGRNYVDTW